MKSWFAARCASLALLFAVAAAAAPTITDIEVRNTGGGRVERSLLEAYTRVRVGEEFNAARISDDVRSLLDTKRFSNVAVEAEETEGGVRLVLVVRLKQRLVGDVEVTGADHLRIGKVRDLLDLNPGDLVDEPTVAVRSRKVIERYRKDRYPDATIAWDLEPVDEAEGLARLTLRIDEGGRARVKTMRFEGRGSMPASKLRKAAKVRSSWNPIGWLFKKRYDADELAQAQVRVRALYLQDGYLDARVGEPQIERADDGALTLTLPIEPGVQYRFGKLTISGNTLFPEAELARRLEAREGFVASSALIDSSARSLRDYYGARGYAETLVRPVLKPDPGRGVVNIEFRIREGELVRIRNILVRGNSRTRDKVLRRELLVYPGEIYNEPKISRSERRLMNLGFFSDVRSYPESVPVSAERDLVFEVEEKRTGQFMIGAGFSSIENLVGFLEISQGNFDIAGWPYFTGGGQKLKLRGQFGSRRKDYELSFVEPWFLDRKLSLGVDLYRHDFDYDDYDEVRTGAAVTLGRSLPGANRLDVRYQLEDVEIKDIADTNAYAFADDPAQTYTFVNEEDRLTSTLKLTLTHDTRDSPFFPTRGNRASVFGSLSGGLLGFDTDLYGAGIRSSHFVPLWFGHVLSFRFRYEVVDAYGGTDEVPLGERLFLGGGRTVRGFAWREVGPKVIREIQQADGSTVVDYRPVGGRTLAFASAEYTIPVVKGIRLAGFYDTGNVEWDLFEMDTGTFAAGAGVGLRLDVPGFPIRIDRAWALQADDEYTKEDEWVIWIGYDY